MKKILIIDDEPAIAGLISEFCSMFGFETRVLNSGAGALEEVRSYQPDLITLDLVMPEISGVEVLKILKKNEDTQSIPVLIISSLGDFHDVRKIVEQCQGILEKPIRANSLKSKIEMALPLLH